MLRMATLNCEEQSAFLRPDKISLYNYYDDRWPCENKELMCCCFTAIGLRCCAFDSALAHWHISATIKILMHTLLLASSHSSRSFSARPLVLAVGYDCVWRMLCTFNASSRRMYCLILRNWMRCWCQFDGSDHRFYEAIKSSIDARKYKVIWHAFYDYDKFYSYRSSNHCWHFIVPFLPTTNSKIYSSIKTWLFIQSHINRNPFYRWCRMRALNCDFAINCMEIYRECVNMKSRLPLFLSLLSWWFFTHIIWIFSRYRKHLQLLWHKTHKTKLI